MTILAVGAAGEFAGLVIPALVERGAHVRGMIRKAEQSEIARKSGAAEVAVADLHERSALLTALRGTEWIFYVAPAFLPDEAEVGKGVVEAAIDAGVLVR